MRDVKSRSQRRVEHRQLIVLLVLTLVVAAVSFSLGWLAGRRGGAPAAPVAVEAMVRQPVTASAEVPAEPAPQEAPKVNLTFYDTLPKGAETPLGSGINLPPEGERKPGDAPATAPAVSDSGTPPAAAPSTAVSPTKAPATSPPPSKPAAVTSGEYVVQVASFRSHEDAGDLQARLLAKGHRAYLQTVDLGDKGVWNRVYIGFFRTEEAAQRTADRIRAEEKITPIVRKR